VDLEDGETLLETAGQESSEQNLPLLDPTVLESGALDPRFSQVKNLIQVIILVTHLKIKSCIYNFNLLNPE